MYTLWILILGLQVGVGPTAQIHPSRPAMQPIATYSTHAECVASGNTLYKFLMSHEVGVDIVCLSTGVSDPVGSRAK